MKPQHSLLVRLAGAQILVAAAAAVAAGLGVRRFAEFVIIQGDMMTMEKLPDFLHQTGLYLSGTVAVTALLAGLLAWLLLRWIMQPLGRITQVTAAVAAGDYGVRIHERRQDELGRLAADIDRMSESLSQVERLRRELVANVAHELRTPLTGALGLIHAMRDGLMAADERNLEQIAEELARLSRLVDAIHQLSVSDAVSPANLERRPLDLVQTTADVVSGMMPLFEQGGLPVELDLPEAPVLVPANRDALVQVLVNLLDNASKYTPDGEWVRVRVAAERETGLIAVCNGGPGIEPEHAQRLFERFYRADQSRAQETGGAGIGLAIVSGLVRAHGGSVQVSSRPGETCFSVRLPL